MKRERRRTPADRLRLDDGGAGFGFVGDAIEETIEFLDRAHVQPGDQAVVADEAGEDAALRRFPAEQFAYDRL